jgi:hypothetical protein
MYLMLGALILLSGVISAQPKIDADCTNRELDTAETLLQDAQDLIAEDDLEGALDLIAEAQELLEDCSGRPEATPTRAPTDTPEPRAEFGGGDFEIADVGTQTFTSDDGQYSFEYPESWFVAVDLGERTLVANTLDASLNALDSPPSPERGDLWIYIAPVDMGRVRNLSSFLETTMANLFPDNETTDAIEFEIEGPDGRRDIRRVAFSDVEDLDVRIMLVELGDGWFGAFYIYARDTEIDGFMPEILVVASTFARE